MEVAGERSVWSSLLRLLPRQPGPGSGTKRNKSIKRFFFFIYLIYFYFSSFDTTDCLILVSSMLFNVVNIKAGQLIKAVFLQLHESCHGAAYN